ncbi:ETX/MTX2 family pore-forming toxin [Bacillus cereus]|uniref:ETX/MTX2 family pore-forming toxin n=1 Tax=Bacillus cereus TaxID=1396 RepID=UPI001D0DC6FF|nr:ETX/MTX2 family pore-forming toxin [Bacillus cereus]MCC2364658.1 ETX/MTX2 family pore-forming toxin [Bacillus cereus]
MAILDFATQADNYITWKGTDEWHTGENYDFSMFPYSVYNVVVTPKSLEVTGVEQTLGVFSQTTNNNTIEPISKTFEFSEKTIDTVSNTTTNGVSTTNSIQATTSAKITVKVAETNKTFQTTLSTTYNFSNSITETHTTEKLWKDSVTYDIPPHYSAIAIYTVVGVKYVVPVYLECDIKGQGYEDGWDNLLCRKMFDTPGYDERSIANAAELSRTEWPSHPPQFQYQGVEDVLHFKGDATTDSLQGYESFLTVTMDPLPGYKGEKIVYTTRPKLINFN